MENLIFHFWGKYTLQFPRLSFGPDRLESIIFDITGKKIDNHRSRLESIISFILDFFFL